MKARTFDPVQQLRALCRAVGIDPDARPVKRIVIVADAEALTRFYVSYAEGYVDDALAIRIVDVIDGLTVDVIEARLPVEESDKKQGE